MIKSEHKRFLKSHGIEFKELSKKAGVTSSAASMWLNGKCNSEKLELAFRQIYNDRIESGNFYFEIEV